MFGLETFDLNKPICIDNETISWDDKEAALRPYHGHRISTIIVGQVGKKTIALPIRNRNTPHLLLPLDQVLKEMREFARAVKIYQNLNIKFDLRCFGVDNVFFPDAEFEDTMVLARLVNNDQLEFNLAYLAERYGCKSLKKDIAKEWCKANHTQDYGKIPIDLLCEYGIGDVDCNLELHNILLKLLPEESQKVWEEEKKFCRLLFNIEHRGIPIDLAFLRKRRIKLIQEMMQLEPKISNITNGKITNPNSSQQVGTFFKGEGIEPLKYNKPTEKQKELGLTIGNACWDKDVLEQIIHPVARMLVDYKKKGIQESTFCDGWAREADNNGRIHPNFKSAGTKTGRPSAEEPNVYNPPKWLMEAITIPDGYVGVKWDKAQIEYRIFAHYSKDEKLLAEYAKNPKVDYHQILADLLGIPRDPTKKINFGILYGMGKDKLTRSIAVAFYELELNEKISTEDKLKIRIALRKYLRIANSKLIVPDTGEIAREVFSVVAVAILGEYHKNVPTVKQVQNTVKSTIQVRRYIKNFFGRRYYYPVNFAYVAANALIQGSAADFFKKKLNELVLRAETVCPSFEMIDMIYDSCFGIVKINEAQAYWDLAKEVVQNSPFRVPVLIDGEVALYNWGNITKMYKDDVLATAGLVCNYQQK